MRLLGVLAVAALSGCSAGAASDNDNSLAVDNLTVENLVVEDTALPAEPKPTARYSEKDGDVYFYVAAVSEEDRKKGRAVGDVVGFKYLGRRGGVYRLQDATPTGAVNECSNPCNIIKTTYPDGYVTRVGFSSTSVIGAAFTDAFNGFLRPVAPPKVAPEPEAEPAAAYGADDATSLQDDTGEAVNNASAETTADF